MSQSIWFISDYHFSHGSYNQETGESKGALNFRKQYTYVEEMDEAIIEIHNSFIKPRDIVYHLGDFIWKGDPKKYLDSLNGQFYIVKGNHDRKVNFNHKKVIHVVDGYYNIKIEKQDITLCHFPMLTWNKSHWNAWHLYGHHHAPLPEHLDSGKRMNVNYDVIHKPVSFEEVKELMSNKEDNWDLIRTDDHNNI